jgi:HEAT repeat protein
MKTWWTAGVICSVLLAGCGEISSDSAESDDRNHRDAASASDKEGSGQPDKFAVPESPDKPPVRREFADMDDAWAVLSQAAADENGDQIWAAIGWLAPQGKPVVERMTNIMNDPSADVADRLAACMVLAEVGPSTRPQLLEALSSDCYNVRVKSAETLGKMQPPTPETVDALIGLLDDKDDRVRRHAVRALAAIGRPAKAATPRLLEILNGPDSHDETLRAEAGRALKQVDPRVGFSGIPPK